MLHSIHKDEQVKKSWKTIFYITYYSWSVLFFVRMVIRIYNGTRYNPNEGYDLMLSLALFFLLAYSILYIVYWINPSLFRSKKQWSKHTITNE